MRKFLLASWLIISSLAAGHASSAATDQNTPETLEDDTRAVITSWASAWQSQLDDVYLLHFKSLQLAATGRISSGAARQRC
jgi:hypothetical protein